MREAWLWRKKQCVQSSENCTWTCPPSPLRHLFLSLLPAHPQNYLLGRAAQHPLGPPCSANATAAAGLATRTRCRRSTSGGESIVVTIWSFIFTPPTFNVVVLVVPSPPSWGLLPPIQVVPAPASARVRAATAAVLASRRPCAAAAADDDDDAAVAAGEAASAKAEAGSPKTVARAPPMPGPCAGPSPSSAEGGGVRQTTTETDFLRYHEYLHEASRRERWSRSRYRCGKVLRWLTLALPHGTLMHFSQSERLANVCIAQSVSSRFLAVYVFAHRLSSSHCT